MSYTQADLDRLDAAIARSELTITYNGRTVTYRSMSELLKARAHVASQLAGQTNAGTRGPRRFGFAKLRD